MAEQSKEELEKWWGTPDAWGYRANIADAERAKWILSLLGAGRFDRALDIGAGEGFITELLPAKEIHAIEISDNAASRLNSKIQRVSKPEGKYDLVLATGVLYYQYDYRQILDWIQESRKHKVVVAGIQDWLVPEISELGEPIFIGTFPYREYKQEVRIY